MRYAVLAVVLIGAATLGGCNEGVLDPKGPIASAERAFHEAKAQERSKNSQPDCGVIHCCLFAAGEASSEGLRWVVRRRPLAICPGGARPSNET